MFPMETLVSKGLNVPSNFVCMTGIVIRAMSCEMNAPDEFHVYSIMFIRFILSLMLYAALVSMVIQHNPGIMFTS